MKYTLYHRTRVALSILAIMSITACSTPLTSNHYNRSDMRIVQEVDYGRIVSLRIVTIDGTDSGQGSATGALAGGVGGSTIGTGNTTTLSMVGGALLGSVVGGGLEEVVTRSQGVELVVELNSGRRIAVVQADEISSFRVGQKVRVMSMGTSARVTPDDGV